MRKKTLCLLLVLVLTMGLTATFSFADSIGNGDASTYATDIVSFATKRSSDTKASASVMVQFSRTADDYVVAIVLQKKTSNGWVTATDVSNSVHYYRGTNKNSIMTYDSWTVKKSVVYRIKCVSTDKYDSGLTFTDTNYSDPF